MVIHYEEALYQVYGPLDLYLTFTFTPQRLSKVVAMPLQVKELLLQPTDTVRDLGVLIDRQLTMEVVRSCFYQLRQRRSIQRSLPTDAWRTLAAAFITSRVDYCNSVLYGVSSQVIRRLQMVLNAAARLVVGVGRYEHITRRASLAASATANTV